MRAIVLSAILLLTIRAGAFAVDAPPFAVLQIQTSHGLRSATVQVAPGPRGIITVVPGATFGSVTVMRIDEDGVVLSDGIKVGIDRDRSYPYVHRYDALLRSDEPTPPPAGS